MSLVTTTPALIRTQIAAQLIAVALLVRQSQEPVESLQAPSHSPVHLEFAVGLTSHRLAAGMRDLYRSEYRVVVPYQLPPKDRIAGTTSALVMQQAIDAALMASDWGALNPRLASFVDLVSTHAPGPDGWIWLEFTFTALHP